MSDHTNNEWISIGDFMAGIVGVLVLFFVIAILITATAQAEAEEKRKQGVRQVMESLQGLIKKSGIQGIELIPEQGVMRLKDTSFAKGSACLDTRLQQLFKQDIAPIIQQSMQTDKGLALQIEGHTDAIPVSNGSSNVALTCAPFDDNYTLSAGRAREARKSLLSNIKSPEIIQRVSVVGYGPDRLLNQANPSSGDNRRVEVRFVVNPS